jgi:hypothetical protein
MTPRRPRGTELTDRGLRGRPGDWRQVSCPPCQEDRQVATDQRQAAVSAMSVMIRQLTEFFATAIIHSMRCTPFTARQMAVVLVITLLVGGSMRAVCSGWTGSAMARMSCCQGEGHDSTQAAADSCCAIGEQQRGGAAPGLAFHAPVPVPVVIAFPPLAIRDVQGVIDRTRWDPDVPIGSPPAMHVLLSVFLI